MADRLLTDDFHQDALPATAVKLAVENLLPRAKVQTAVCNRHDDLAPHDLPLQMGVAVVLAGAVMTVAADGIVRS